MRQENRQIAYYRFTYFDWVANDAGWPTELCTLGAEFPIMSKFCFVFDFVSVHATRVVLYVMMFHKKCNKKTIIIPTVFVVL